MCLVALLLLFSNVSLNFIRQMDGFKPSLNGDNLEGLTLPLIRRLLLLSDRGRVLPV